MGKLDMEFRGAALEGGMGKATESQGTVQWWRRRNSNRPAFFLSTVDVFLTYQKLMARVQVQTGPHLPPVQRLSVFNFSPGRNLARE